jgi:MHS family proline/betaine transporter-like MFS transporter
VREELTDRLRQGRRAFGKDDVQVVEPSLLRRAVGASALGNCMEWFDFGVYSYLAAIIGKVFFPGASPAAQVISSFATFAAAFVSDRSAAWSSGRSATGSAGRRCWPP